MSLKAKIFLIFQIFCFNVFLLLVLLVGIEVLWRVTTMESPIAYQRTFPGEYENAPFKKNSSWAQHDQDLGWTFNRESVIRGRGVSYHANQQGFRDDKDFNSTETGDVRKSRICILGDSFVFGSFIEQEDTLPELLEKELGGTALVYNLGVPGWGIDQMYLAYKKYAPQIKPDTVLLFLIDDDVSRVFEAFRRYEKMNKPSFEIQKGKLAFRTTAKPGFWDKYQSRSLILQRFYLFYRKVHSKKIVELIFKELNEQCKKRGEKLAVVRIPLLEDLRSYDARSSLERQIFSFKKFSNAEHIVYIELIDYLRQVPKEQYESFYLPNDNHLSKKGTEFITSIVAEAMKGELVV